MANPALQAQKREVSGKRVRFLRRRGITPANIYGHNVQSEAIQVDTRNLEKVLAVAGRSTLIDLKVDGGQGTTVLARQIQRHPLTGNLLHVDFFQVSMTERIRADVPIVLVGEAPAARSATAMLLHGIDVLHVECLPGDLPHAIEVDVSNLRDVGDAIHVKDLRLNPAITLHVDPEKVIVKMAATKVVEEVPAGVEAEAAEKAEAPGEGAETA